MAKGSLDDKKGSAEVKKMPVKIGIFLDGTRCRREQRRTWRELVRDE